MVDAKITDTLDTTQFSDMSDEQLLSLGLTTEEIATLRAIPAPKLSSMIPIAVAAGKAKAKEIQSNLTFDPEIDVSGHRRCVYVSVNGDRCTNYGTKDLPVCSKHKSKAASLGTYFRSPKLRETYEAFNNSPVKMHCDGELALMRTMLSALLEKINDDNINLEVIGAVTAMCEKITTTVDRMSKLEKITPEQLNNLMIRMVDVAAKYIDPEKLELFAKDVEDMKIGGNKVVANYDFIPGEVIDGETIKEVKAAIDNGADIQRKALKDIADKMGIVNEQ